VIDTRNSYETAVGTFKSAIDPELKTFRDFLIGFGERDRLLGQGKAQGRDVVPAVFAAKNRPFLKAEGVEDVFTSKAVS
jgi:UPF0176 protein